MTDRPDPVDGTPRPRPAPAGSVVDMRDAPPAVARPGTPNAAPAEPAPPIGSTLVGKQGAGLPPMQPRGAEADKTAAAGQADEPHPLPPAPPRESLMQENPIQGTTSAPDRSDRPAPPAGRPAPAPAPAPAAAAPRRGGFAPLFLGGVVAAGLGAGAAWWAIPRLPPAWRPAPAAVPAIDTAALTEAAMTAARADMDRRAADLESRAAAAATQAARQAAAEAASQAAGAGLSSESLVEQARQAGSEAAARLIAEGAASGQADGTLSAALAAQAQQLAALDQRVAALAERPQPAAPAVDLAPIRQQLDQLAQRPVLDPAAAERLARLAEEADAVTARIDQAAATAEQRLRDAESRAAALGEAADAAARRARAAAAAAALGEAVQTGSPRAEALAQLQEAGVQPPAALSADIPTLEALAADFPAAARAALRADLRSAAAGGTGSVIGNFLRAQTGARSVAPRTGTDADAVLSRAQDAVQRGAIGTALTELEALPAAARPAMQPWIDRARRYADAQAALTSLSAPQGAAPAAPEPGGPASAPPTPAPAADNAGAGAPAAPAAPSN